MDCSHVNQHCFLQRLTKVALHTPVQHTLLEVIVRIGRDEDRWDRVPTFDQMVVKFYPRHFRHVNVHNEARGGREVRGRKELGSTAPASLGITETTVKVRRP
jgi:hypothetical protein